DGDDHLNGSSLAGHPLDEAATMECHDHVVHRRWRHFEVLLNVGPRRRSSVQLRVHRDIHDVLTLESGEPHAHTVLAAAALWSNSAIPETRAPSIGAFSAGATMMRLPSRLRCIVTLDTSR